jgi:phage protein D
VPQSYKAADGYKLGNWVNNQRALVERIGSVHKAQLEALPGWVWDTREAQWEEGFRYLKEFADREGHSKVVDKYRTEDGYRLGGWVAIQRSNKDSMPTERKAQLEALPGWSFDPYSDQWEEGFRYLKAFSDMEGHSMVSHHYRTIDGYQLGTWVDRQRRVKDSIFSERIAQLETLPGWTWAPHADKWEEGFQHLQKFFDREGHAKVPDAYNETGDGYRLGYWVRRQLQTENSMLPERKARLEGLPGWVWSVNKDTWEEGFCYLKEFADREEHSRVPQLYKMENGYQLGLWVGRQRSTKDTMHPERKARLEALPGWIWGEQQKTWDEWFCCLKEFADREGHANVPSEYKTADGYRLGGWVYTQRSKKDSLPSERKARLDALPGWCWDAREYKWEEGFRYLKEFSDQAGHCKVADKYRTAEGYQLGSWVGRQRSTKDTMPPERKLRLEALPSWVWRFE